MIASLNNVYTQLISLTFSFFYQMKIEHSVDDMLAPKHTHNTISEYVI